APHIAQRYRDDLRAAARKPVAAILTLRTRRTRRAGLARNAAWVVGRLGGAAFSTCTAFTSSPSVAALAAGNLGVHESREERLFGGRDDRDLSAPAAGSSAAPVAPRAAGAAGATGTAGLSVRSRNPCRPIGATRPTRTAGFDDEPIGRWHGARIRDHVVGRGFFDFDAGDEQPVIKR